MVSEKLSETADGHVEAPTRRSVSGEKNVVHFGDLVADVDTVRVETLDDSDAPNEVVERSSASGLVYFGPALADVEEVFIHELDEDAADYILTTDLFGEPQFKVYKQSSR